MTADDKPKYPLKYIYDALSILATMWFLDYAGISFIVRLFLYGSYYYSSYCPWSVA
jgi:hypothetical protein